MNSTNNSHPRKWMISQKLRANLIIAGSQTRFVTSIHVTSLKSLSHNPTAATQTQLTSLTLAYNPILPPILQRCPISFWKSPATRASLEMHALQDVVVVVQRDSARVEKISGLPRPVIYAQRGSQRCRWLRQPGWPFGRPLMSGGGLHCWKLCWFQ